MVTPSAEPQAPRPSESWPPAPPGGARPSRLAPQPLGRLRRGLAVGVVKIARRLMPLLVGVAGERCWDCGRKITPTAKLDSYHIVEARLWAWEEVVCDSCVRARLTRFGGRGPKSA